ncbi:diaminopimelate epimerase [Novipirellula artificiosorum]|uniref:Diaminopimelate epimerase n=1 Tax=Novipirellula artificiosorum TaxID=2528016 RepID=A0A5C6DQ11_9BACT|nr:diaminopimelate epimerase [Novipirellula artificiosorum]TWU37106.1 Diaminopimelate epimerase [Novipirellula artificiosorum]
MRFTKMHGAGNDYVYVDCFAENVDQLDLPELAKRISHRHYGVGGDGLILIRPSAVADAKMQMFNADGSESEMCGNGIRCVAKYVYDHRIACKEQMRIETGAGVLDLSLSIGADEKTESVTVDMGVPILEAASIPTRLVSNGKVVDHEVEFAGQHHRVSCVSMGNPHCVLFVPEATDELVLGLGPLVEVDPRFPNRTNVEFVQVLSRREVRQRTWERGSGETWACGTGASAVCVAGVLTGRTDRTILNHLLGGDLTMTWDESTSHVRMTGGAVEVFSGQWNE